MGSDDKFEGTGDEIGRIDLGEFGDVVIEDDGHHDNDVYAKFDDPSGGLIQAGRHYKIAEYRRNHGDEALKECLDDLSVSESSGGSTANGGGSDDSPTSFGRPVAFKCDQCNRTFPRTRNATADDPAADVCDECDDGGDSP